MKNKSYFADQYESANNDFYSFDENLYADDARNATEVGQGGAAAVNVATPFIITLENTTGAAISNVTFLDAVNAIQLGVAGNYGVAAGVTVSYGIPNVDYGDFLYSLLTTSVMISSSYIQSNTSSQLLETIKIETSDVRGKGAYDLFNPIIDPYQQQTLVLIMPNKFILNNFTKLTISSIAKNTSVKLMLFPSAVESTIGGLTGRTANFSSLPAVMNTARRLG